MSDDPTLDTSDIRRITRSLAEHPERWPEVRDNVKEAFDLWAPGWEDQIEPDKVAPLLAGLQRVAPGVGSALDVGTGTGRGARALSEHFPDAAIVGADLSVPMIREAVAHTPAGGPRYLVGDGSALPFHDGTFDLVSAMNVFLFWDEVRRVLRPGGYLVVVYTNRADTPIYLPWDEVQGHLSAVGSWDFEDGDAGTGTWLLARLRT